MELPSYVQIEPASDQPPEVCLSCTLYKGTFCRGVGP
jgi:hypothetical protein